MPGEYIDYDRLKAKNIRIITFAHNVEYEFQKDVLSKFGFLSKLEINRTYHYEKANLRKADRIISISPADYHLLQKSFNWTILYICRRLTFAQSIDGMIRTVNILYLTARWIFIQIITA